MVFRKSVDDAYEHPCRGAIERASAAIGERPDPSARGGFRGGFFRRAFRRLARSGDGPLLAVDLRPFRLVQ